MAENVKVQCKFQCVAKNVYKNRFKELKLTRTKGTVPSACRVSQGIYTYIYHVTHKNKSQFQRLQSAISSYDAFPPRHEACEILYTNETCS